jgi:hypothetical protein
LATPIYHITDWTNLENILSSGRLLCDRRIALGEAEAVGIGHKHIKERRAKRVVTVGPSGVVADYVPFYFAPRSPMLYSIDCGQVEGYPGGQGGVVHLVTSVERVVHEDLRFVFTDGHAEMAISRQFTDLAHLDQIDWSVMQGKWWNDTPEHPDRKRRRQAEFLIHDVAPWILIEQIGVASDAARQNVEALLAAAEDTTPISVRPEWYY